MTNEERKVWVDYRLERALSTLKEVDLLVENQMYNAAVNRMYYACYYAVTALLLANKIEIKTHAGARQRFGQHFVKNRKIEVELGKFYSEIFTKRQSGDYEDMIVFSEDDVKGLLPNAIKLINAIEKLL